MFIDYVTLMLVNIAAGFFVLAGFLVRKEGEPAQPWAPGAPPDPRRGGRPGLQQAPVAGGAGTPGDDVGGAEVCRGRRAFRRDQPDSGRRHRSRGRGRR